MPTLNCLLHPHHVSLMRNPNTATNILYHLAEKIDPYYEYDAMPSHRGLLAPRFDVVETEKAFILDGEVPGIADKKSIRVTWLGHQVLMVDGEIKLVDSEIKPTDGEAAEVQTGQQAPKEPNEHHLASHKKHKIDDINKKPSPEYPHQLLRERRLGAFQRSFTFPDEVDADGMKATLKDGILRILVPKKADTAKVDKTIHVE